MSLELIPNAIGQPDMKYEAYEDNAAAFNELLKQIEEASATSASQRDKGTRFETLTRVFFENARGEFSGRYSKIETFKEWVRNTPGYALSAQDIGIDLVATREEDGLYAAIQCKFYGEKQRVDSASIDSFIAASANPDWFVERIVVATNSADMWTNHAREKLAWTNPPVQLLTREDLGNADIDWSSYLRDPDHVKKIEPRKPRPYQQEAIKKVMTGFETHARGKLIMACGTGKTFTSMKIAEAFVENGAAKTAPIMFLVPSLSLLSQTLSDWK
jgi:predicted helicase